MRKVHMEKWRNYNEDHKKLALITLSKDINCLNFNIEIVYDIIKENLSKKKEKYSSVVVLAAYNSTRITM